MIGCCGLGVGFWVVCSCMWFCGVSGVELFFVLCVL